MKIASLNVLSFERKDFLEKSLNSLKLYTDYPHEIIVNDDGSSDKGIAGFLYNLYLNGDISYLILNAGKNMGVGKSLRNGIGISSGDYIFKLDADLQYMPNWLSTIIGILENNPDVGCCGLFNYRNYDKNDTRFEILEEREDCYIVTDFVNSGYGFKREIFNRYGASLGDDGWQQEVKKQSLNLKLAIPKKDVVYNFGFGKDTSTYIGSTKSELPKVFKK